MDEIEAQKFIDRCEMAVPFHIRSPFFVVRGIGVYEGSDGFTYSLWDQNEKGNWSRISGLDTDLVEPPDTQGFIDNTLSIIMEDLPLDPATLFLIAHGYPKREGGFRYYFETRLPQGLIHRSAHFTMKNRQYILYKGNGSNTPASPRKTLSNLSDPGLWIKI